MKDFLVLFREPDGRTIEHAAEATRQHQLNWKNWLEHYGKQGNLVGGKGLTLNGKVIRETSQLPTDGPYQVGKEIVGGFLLIRANNLDEAVEIVKTCPIFEFDGFAEVREMM
jgi:hypothetical protein